MKRKILIIQPLIPHYREPFFDGLAKKYELLVLYGRYDKSFELCKKKYAKKVKSLVFSKIEYFHIWRDLIKFKPDVVITYGEVKQLTNIFLLFSKRFFHFKLIIWSHGFKKKKLTLMDRLRLVQMKKADGVVFYTRKGMNDANSLGLNNTAYLNNTIDIKKIISQQLTNRFIKSDLKNKYRIKTKTNGIFISRFYDLKKPELLLELMLKINSMNPDIGFIIIGDGDIKPNFSDYNFIYDFGRMYDNEKKGELMHCADFAFMPSGIGLSVVESFVYSLAMFTMTPELETITHGVEINYVQNNYNGYIADSEDELINTIVHMPLKEFQKLGNNAFNFVKDNLTMNNMINNMTNYINSIN